VGGDHLDRRQDRHDAGDPSQVGRQAERDGGRRPGLSTEERERLKNLEKENKELRRANEILKAASLQSTDQRNTLSNISAGVA
jgi:transposase